MSSAGMEPSLAIETNPSVHLVLFRLGEQSFALPVEEVRQIIEMVAIIRLPEVEAFIEGVINVRGKMAPVVDLRRVLKKGTPTRGLNTPLILVEVKKQLTGIIVDEVLNVIELPAERIARLDEFMPVDAARTPILRGIANPADDCVMVLDLDHLFEPGQREAIGEMAASLESLVRQTEEAEEGRQEGSPVQDGKEMVGADLSVCPPAAKRKASRGKRARALQSETVLKVLRETMETER